MEAPLMSQWLDYVKKQSIVEKKLEDILKKNNQLTTSEYYALYQLKQNGRCMRLNDLGNYLCLSQSALSRMINRLEDRIPAVIERRICADDKRGVYIDLTNEGAMLMASVEQDVNAILKEYFI
ncbi:MarR family winged helix-turn-helix transcriptional regulator [Candidatus Enterococcus ikei]|uniref:MarR family transcriptional regulator n=1 Tax=Candidatus Enterococcus ikei TaxID=2815326 RepID=A0ABS3GZU9_9ENTE|nr:MarR family transcriptional regulator [Enterococcus sp. DIV0869a]MBO0440786.1 MarR family transcriptional regulator [Enterococcus sp. DIV0869a]